MRLVERLVGSERGEGAGIRQEMKCERSASPLSTQLTFRQTYEGGYGSALGCEAQGSHARTRYKGLMFISRAQVDRHSSR